MIWAQQHALIYALFSHRNIRCIRREDIKYVGADADAYETDID